MSRKSPIKVWCYSFQNDCVKAELGWEYSDRVAQSGRCWEWVAPAKLFEKLPLLLPFFPLTNFYPVFKLSFYFAGWIRTRCDFSQDRATGLDSSLAQLAMEFLLDFNKLARYYALPPKILWELRIVAKPWFLSWAMKNSCILSWSYCSAECSTTTEY